MFSWVRVRFWRVMACAGCVLLWALMVFGMVATVGLAWRVFKWAAGV